MKCAFVTVLLCKNDIGIVCGISRLLIFYSKYKNLGAILRASNISTLDGTTFEGFIRLP